MTETPNSLASIVIDEVEILRKLRLTPEAILVCQRYGLDPIRKHVVIVDGTPYVTRDGLLALAHRSGVFDGMDVRPAVLDEQSGEWRSEASIYRRDMSRPFTFAGRYPKGKKNSPEMAEKVAVARALRHAFDVSIPTDDERHLTVAVEQSETSAPGGLGRALAARREVPEPAVDDVPASVVDGVVDEPEVTE